MSALFARTANNVYSIVIVLFVLDRFHSAPLAGLTVMMATLPALAVSPLAGALLDRRGRAPLIVTDYLIAAGGLTLLWGLARAGALPRWALLSTVTLAGLTMPLSSTGMRTLFPALVPRHLWDRANAVDSGGYVVATIVGPGMAGVAVAGLGPTDALLVPAAGFAAGAAVLFGLHLPRAGEGRGGRLLRDAADAVVYVVRHRELRAMAVGVSVFNLGFGAVTVGLPLLVLRDLHGGPDTVGLLFAVMGVAGIFAGLAAGRVGSDGRERSFLIVGFLATTPALVALAVFQHSELVAGLAMALIGAANGPLDVGLFSWRQRVTDPEWIGRGFAVSMGLNYAGFPIGAALAGPIVDRSLGAGFGVAAFLTVLGAGLLVMMTRVGALAPAAREG